MSRDPAVDAYIERAAPFAQPILRHIRAAMHLAVPGAGEAVKWSRPFFTRDGRAVAMMSAFKAHVSFGVWLPPGGTSTALGDPSWDRVTDVATLPEVAPLAARLAAALASLDAAPTPVRTRRVPPAAAMPADLLSALAAVPSAEQVFSGFPIGARNDYVEWVTGAKRPETRAARIAQAVAWIVEGKRRNWKYERC